MDNIQWFPGHMARARRVIEEGLKLVDIVVEIVDARIPLSSQNPEIDRILKSKKRIIVCNKADLSDEKMNKAFKAYFLEKGTRSIFTDAQKGQGIREVLREIEDGMKEKTDRAIARGRKKPIIRVMVVGIPNVGKSSFINRVTGRYSAVTADKPGVTRNKQWLRINDNIHLLDTPGLLWPKFEDQDAALKLACTGAIKDDILDVNALSLYLIDFLVKNYPTNIENRFNFTIENINKHTILEEIGKRRGCLIKGGEIDYLRASNIVLDDFRSGKLGRITLDRLEDV